MNPCPRLRTAFAALALPALLAAECSAAGPWLFYLEKAGDQCLWNALDVSAKASRVVHKTAECPQDVIWDEEAGRTVYRLGADLFSLKREPKAEPRRLGKAAGAGDGRLWISPETGRLRSARLVPVADKDVVASAGKTSFMFEGKPYDASGLVEWGTPQMALLEELGEDGQWRRLDAKPTKSEAGDTPGLGVLGAMEKRAGTHSLSDLLLEDACSRSRDGCAGKSLPKQGLEAAARLVPLDDESDQAVYFPTAGRGGVLFKLTFGDTAHASPPVFLCAEDCSKSAALADVKDSQLLVWPRDAFVLIATEYEGAKPRVYKPADPAPVWRSDTARAAVWLAFDGSRL